MLRESFPAFQEGSLVYLDSAASTQKPAQVVDAMKDFYLYRYANVHRGVYPLSEEATRLYEKARAVVAAFIGASPDEIVFLRNTTEALNLVAQSWAGSRLRPGDVVMTTVMEHHSNFVPWQQVARRTGASFRVLPIDSGGRLEMERLERELARGVRLLAVAQASNVLGTVNPIEAIVEAAHRYGTMVVIDGAQGLPHLGFNVRRCRPDFYAFSGHKAYGPTGIGVLYGRRELLEAMPPVLFGGEMISQVHLTETTFNEVPYKFEAGTPPIAEAIGLAHALEFVYEAGMERIRTREQDLTDKAMDLLEGTDRVQVYGPPAQGRIGVVAFNVEGVHPHDVAGFLGDMGICVRAGHHCAQPLHEFLGLTASVRLSLGLYNEESDIEAFAAGLEQLKRIFSVVA